MSIGIESQAQTQQSEQTRPARRNYGAYSEGGYVPGEMEVPEYDNFSFGDVLDIVNPLQHIPGVNMAYRELTGDQMDAPARILGGMLYGGPVGFVSGLANSLLEEGTGRSVGETVVAQVFGEEAAPAGGSGEQYAARPSEVNAAAAANTPAQATQGSTPERYSGERHSGGTAGTASSNAAALTGMDALRAFASDQETSASPAAAPQNSKLPEDTKEKDYYALNPSAQPPTTAATTATGTAAGTAWPSGQHRPGEIQQAQAPQQAQTSQQAHTSQQAQTSQSAPARSGSGTPPPDESFMPLGNDGFRGRSPASAERMPLPDSISGPAAGHRMSAGSMGAGASSGLPGSAMNVMPGRPGENSQSASAAPGLSSSDGNGFPGAANHASAGGKGNIAQQMKAALLKYQVLQDE